jgi:hypothetical protein
MASRYVSIYWCLSGIYCINMLLYLLLMLTCFSSIAGNFEGTSQEFLGAAIYHECFHALVKYLSNNNVTSEDQHLAMYSNYLNLLGDGLQAAYPNMQLGEAKGLILKGLLNLDCDLNGNRDGCWNSSNINSILNYSQFSRSQINTIYSRYQEIHSSGTKCN